MELPRSAGSVDNGAATNASASDRQDGSSVEVGTHFFNQLYLYAFATRAEVARHVRTQAAPSEKGRLSQLLVDWEKLRSRVNSLASSEAGIAERIGVEPIAEPNRPQVLSYANDPLFQRTFSQLPIDFSIVEIDKLIAPQRTVNLDYVARLTEKLPDTLDMPNLLEFCVSPKRDMDPIQHLEIGLNTHVFSSPNSDIRFLGSFVKTLGPGDLDFAQLGGVPAAAVISFVGYGGAPINVIRAGNRIVLNNGFHRVYALRSVGVSKIPVVVQISSNPTLDFPPSVAGLPKEYLLRSPRPVLLKDFFEADFNVTLHVKDRIKMVTISTNRNEHEIPA